MILNGKDDFFTCHVIELRPRLHHFTPTDKFFLCSNLQNTVVGQDGNTEQDEKLWGKNELLWFDMNDRKTNIFVRGASGCIRAVCIMYQ